MRDRWSSERNSTLNPGDSGSILTPNPGFGVAHSTWTPDAENDTAVVPPVSTKVWVVAGAAVVVGAAGWVVDVELVDGVVFDGVVVDVVWGTVVLVDELDDESSGPKSSESSDDDRDDESSIVLVVTPGVAVDGGWARVVLVDPESSDPESSELESSELESSDPESSLEPGVVASVLVVKATSSTAWGGATTWLSTTDTPAQATRTAAALAEIHIQNNMSFFMR
jgi:hypothetical protein